MAVSPAERLALIRKIVAKIRGHPDVQAALAIFPNPISECWEWTGAGSTPTIRVGQTTRTVVPILFELGCGEPLHDSWTPRRKSDCSSRRCVNPTHFELKPHNQNRYGAEGPLPAKLMPRDSTEEIQDVLEIIEDWEHPERAEFVERCAALRFDFSPTAIDAAYARLAITDL